MRRPGVKIRIFIADDHPIVRQGLRRIVEADPGMVISGEADGAAALLAGLETKATDLVLLDVSIDRKSTRLNSSHSQISYAVFCLKKKKKRTQPPTTRTP